MASPFASESTRRSLDECGVDYKGFQIGVTAIVIRMKQKLRDAKGQVSKTPPCCGISGALSSAADSTPFSDGIENFRR